MCFLSSRFQLICVGLRYELESLWLRLETWKLKTLDSTGVLVRLSVFHCLKATGRELSFNWREYAEINSLFMCLILCFFSLVISRKHGRVCGRGPDLTCQEKKIIWVGWEETCHYVFVTYKYEATVRSWLGEFSVKTENSELACLLT